MRDEGVVSRSLEEHAKLIRAQVRNIRQSTHGAKFLLVESQHLRSHFTSAPPSLADALPNSRHALHRQGLSFVQTSNTPVSLAVRVPFSIDALSCT